MFLLLHLFLSLCSPIWILACTCILRPEPQTVADARDALGTMEAVFTGQVLQTNYRRDSTRVHTIKGDSTWFRSTTLVATVVVKQVWKGRVRDTLQVETNAQTTACGASLQKGEHYLIEANRISGSAFATSKCGWTRPLSRAMKLQALLDDVVVK